MNKKVSTLLTMGLFLGGSLFNFVSAENLSDFIKDWNATNKTATEIKKLESGKQYFLGINNLYLHSTVEDGAINYNFVRGGEVVEKEDLQEYLWTVTAVQQGSGSMAYTFTNAKSGKQIFFVEKNNEWTVSDNPDEKFSTTTQNLFYWGTNTTPVNYSAENVQFVATTLVALNKQNQNTENYLGIANNTLAVVDAPAPAPKVALYGIADGIDVTVDDLNDLYNSAGFNFALNDDDLASVTNIFADKRIIALNVSDNVKKDDEHYFPKGTYFVTSVPYLWDYEDRGNLASVTAKNNMNEKGYDVYDYLTRCTFVAVDSDNNIADDADEMKEGKGFTLTEVSGKDLVLYQGTEDKFKAQGNQIAVCNANFDVKESATSDVYKLTVATVRALEKAGAEKQVENNNLDITASEDFAQILTGANSASGNYIFKFAESTVEKGISFLKEDGAAIYNIKFYLKNGADNSYNAKYLTMDATGVNFIAKGAVLADLDAPAYQWVISKVNGNNVTFTNRETGETFETQLFKEDGGRYSLYPAEANDDDTFIYFNVDEKGDVVAGRNSAGNIDNVKFRGVYVELIDSEAVNYSGYLNVEDGSVMTLSFGRDIAPTSNKLYPIVDENTLGFGDGAGHVLTNDVALAAQWKLVKSASNHPIKYNYAYANGDLVNIKNNGDVVYAYTYKLQLVLNGNAIDNQYLTIQPRQNRLDEYTIGAGTDFYIQENEDGSVLLKDARDGVNALFLQGTYDNEGEPLSISDLINSGFAASTIYNYNNNTGYLSKSTDVKTYLIAEAPAVSLPGNEGHYSIASTDGNYITMNDERDAMTVKEASEPLYLYVGDKEDVTPSFYITKAAQNKAERMFLFNPADSINYYVAEGQYDKEYQLVGGDTKAIFKAAAINETRDTLTTNIKGVSTLVASEANNSTKVSGGLNRFKMQILESDDADGTYVIRQKAGQWLKSLNGTLVWGNKLDAMKFDVEGAEAPTSNESVAASEVKVIANNGSINVKNAAGKNVVVSTILGQVVANEVLTSDNATINVPAGIVVVAVEGESFKINVR